MKSEICNLKSCILLLAVLAAQCLFSDRLWASGDEFTLIGHDLQVDVDSRWVGCEYGGYCPIRVKVVNRGPARTLTFRLNRTYQALPTVKQTFQIDQNETRSFSLSVPMVSEATSGEFRVEHRGAMLEKMSRSVNLPEFNLWQAGRPAMIVVANAVVDSQAFDSGVATCRHTHGLATTSHHYGGTRGSTCQVLPEKSLPDNWIDYTGLDFVVMTRESLERLPRVTRTALTQWARCGGTFVVTAAGDLTSEVANIQKLLGSDNTSKTAWQWRESNLSDRDVNSIITDNGSGGISSISPPPTNLPAAWNPQPAPFRIADFGFGKLVVFADNPFPGTAQDWFWLLKSLGGAPRWDWMQRHGLTARGGHSEFLHFLIPGIRGVPVVMFLVLITLFSIVIGPLNYFLLAHRKRLHLLVITIPLIAFATSMLLFGYAVVAHGFGIKARARSLTFIDQSAQAAVTMNRLSLYAGQAPSAGLQFSRDTAVYPIWPEQSGFENGQIDWTDKQVLTSGWLRSRTRTQFLTVRHRDERGRLQVTPRAADLLTVANGFEWGFQHLVVVDDQGTPFLGRDIPAGANVDLRPAGVDEFKLLRATLMQDAPQLPDVLSRGPSQGIIGELSNAGYRRSWHYGHSNTPLQGQFQSSTLEQTWQRMLGTAVGATELDAPELAKLPRVFFGLAASAPDVEFGVPNAKEVASIHAVIGRW